MNFDGFAPHEITRFGGFVDILDATSLPLGVAALCKNCKFMLTGVECRWGFQTQMQSPNADAQITGGISGIYTAENPGEVRFQVPMIFDSDGYLLKESPVGTGRMVRIQGPLVTLPDAAQMLATQAQNYAFTAFTTDLDVAAGPQAVYNLKRAALEPFGQKPFGWNWIKNTALLVGEYGTPSVTGGTSPSLSGVWAWPLAPLRRYHNLLHAECAAGPFFYVTQVKLTALPQVNNGTGCFQRIDLCGISRRPVD